LIVSASGCLFAAEFAVACGIKGAQGELFSYSIIAAPSMADYFLGPLTVFGYVAAIQLWFFQVSRLPCELGPHVNAGFIAWKFVANVVIVYFFLPSVVEAEASPWLTLKIGYACSVGAAVLSILGFALFYNNLNEDFDKTRFWRRCTGKQMILEMWDDEKIWTKGYATKDEDRASYVMTIHPNYHTKSKVEEWLCDELLAKFAPVEIGAAEEGVLAVVPPKWLSREFATRVNANFVWWGGGESGARVREALERLVPGTEVEAGE